MKKKFMIAVCIVSVVSLLGISAAEAVTVTFKENGRTGYWWSYTPGPDEFGPDILVYGVNQHGDGRDPFDHVGISPIETNPDLPGIIQFVAPTQEVTVDWMSIFSTPIEVEAFDADHNLVDSFTRTGTDAFWGTDVLTGNISSIEFHNLGGRRVTISTLTFEHTPEPASMVMLGCLGAGMLGIRKVTRRKKR